MKCSEVQELLSDYYDGELADGQQSRVSDHISRCSACANGIAGFEELSRMANAFEASQRPEDIWSKIQQQRDEQPTDGRLAAQPVDKAGRRRSSFPAMRLFAVAATVVVATGIGWLAYQSWYPHGEHSQFTAEFDQYLDAFRRDATAAQHFLLAKYENELVQTDQVIQRMGYRPATADGVPQAYSIDATYVMKMPCCVCVQCLCKRPDGSTIAIFEHDDEETTEWFGERPEMSATCSGKRCSLVELNDSIAATWQRDTRHITVVGLRDVAELTELVAWFDEQKRARLPK